MRTSDFDYELPPELVAQRPAGRREEARLLVHDVERDATEHARVAELPRFLAPGDLLVLNDTRVVPARVFGRRASGGRVELLFLEPLGDDPAGPWTAFCNPARKLRPGEELAVARGGLVARMLERRRAADGRPAKEWVVALGPPDGPSDTLGSLERHGHVPVPPYVERPGRKKEEPAAREAEALERLDRERYQTVYARVPGAVAAPTAGLHFTPELLAALEARGVRSTTVTLHVGAGTFEPVEVERVEEHRMHSERFELSAEAVEAVEETRRRGGRVVAVGTTSVRVLETRAREPGGLSPGTGRTELFLRPGSPFLVVDALLTNFHLPRSTLLMLVSAFAGRERVLRLYAEAVARRYRFYSYGDAMLVVRGAPAPSG